MEVCSQRACPGRPGFTLHNQRAFDSDFCFLDQIAILPEFQDRGFGERCFLAFTQTVKGPYYAAMLEQPVRNPRIQYWEKRGFMRIDEAEEVLQARFEPHEHPSVSCTPLLWGIYLLQDAGYRPFHMSEKN